MRQLVGEVDPTFGRTVVVSTKLDTKLAQLSGTSDLLHFLAARGHLLDTS